MKIKNLIRLTEQQPVSVQLFYKLATEHSIDFKKVYKFLIRLEKLRRILKWNEYIKSTNTNLTM